MIDNYLLTELVTFSLEKTLSKTAAKLGVTQPAITRALKKLENDLGVALFDRQPNKLLLTDTGEFAAAEAAKVLTVNEGFAAKVRNFDQTQAKIAVAANAPGPMIVLRAVGAPNVEELPGPISGNYAELLNERQTTCLLLNEPLDTATLTSTYLGIERMAVNLPPESPLASRQEISFGDLHGQTILSPYGIGFWEQIYRHRIPGARILYQKQANDYSELLNYSTLPYFTTNLTQLGDEWGHNLPNNRVNIPLRDRVAQQKFFACYRKEDRRRLGPLIQQLQDQWSAVD